MANNVVFSLQLSATLADGQTLNLPASFTLGGSAGVGSAIPEPSTFVLIGGGLLALLWGRRKRRVR